MKKKDSRRRFRHPFAIVIVAKTGRCRICGDLAGIGPVGFKATGGDGPVCDRCLRTESPKLGLVLSSVMAMREMAELLRKRPLQLNSLLTMMSAVCDLTNTSQWAQDWPCRPLGLEALCEAAPEEIQEVMNLIGRLDRDPGFPH